jgi:hypothetical protein
MKSQSTRKRNLGLTSVIVLGLLVASCGGKSDTASTLPVEEVVATTVPETTTTTTIPLLDPGVIPEIQIYDFQLLGIHIDHYIDSPVFKKVEAYTRQLGSIILWEGDAYDAIGQWTDADAQARLAELLSN